jgi:hypothetical protein
VIRRASGDDQLPDAHGPHVNASYANLPTSSTGWDALTILLAAITTSPMKNGSLAR